MVQHSDNGHEVFPHMRSLAKKQTIEIYFYYEVDINMQSIDEKQIGLAIFLYLVCTICKYFTF